MSLFIHLFTSHVDTDQQQTSCHLSRVWESVLISRYGTMSCPPSQSADAVLKEIAMRQSAEDANDDG